MVFIESANKLCPTLSIAAELMPKRDRVNTNVHNKERLSLGGGGGGGGRGGILVLFLL